MKKSEKFLSKKLENVSSKILFKLELKFVDNKKNA